MNNDTTCEVFSQVQCLARGSRIRYLYSNRFWVFFKGAGKHRIYSLIKSNVFCLPLLEWWYSSSLSYYCQLKYDSHSFCTVHARSERTCTQHNTFTGKHGYVR